MLNLKPLTTIKARKLLKGFCKNKLVNFKVTVIFAPYNCQESYLNDEIIVYSTYLENIWNKTSCQ